MTSSTIRSAIDGTISESPLEARLNSLQQVVAAEWQKSGHADLVRTLREHPQLLRDKSQLLNLAIEEYRTNSNGSPGSDLEQHCHRFHEFGSSVERSIFRQLEAQRYIDCHPELLNLFSTPDWPKTGDQFGDFQILEELGVGAAAHVYLCLQADVGFRQVVVKATPFSSAEASILGRLSHPNIVEIYSTGSVEESNLNYLCMPFRGRSTLGDLLDIAFRDEPPRDDGCISTAAMRWMHEGELVAQTPRRRWLKKLRRRSYVDGILQIAVQIADALEAAHKQGILHGDLKPSNVLLTPDGRPLLLDFNLSQDFVRSPSVCGGTLPYMPPEYLRVLAKQSEFKRDSKFNAAPDVYSFGALLYELLIGDTPVKLEEVAEDSSAIAKILHRQLEAGVPALCGRNRFVSRRLESIVLRCLSFDAKNRPADMAEVKDGLQAELSTLPMLGRSARLRPILFGCAVGLPMIALGGTGAYLAAQPAAYVTAYNEGMKLESVGKFDEAADRFAASAKANPSFAPARFELGQLQLASGDVDAAMEGFNRLARKDRDIHSMAYLGFCFNKRPFPEAAIPWYERAIHAGASSAAIYNNLGASYLDARPSIPPQDQLRRAELYINKALALDPKSKAAQLNLVRLATAEPSYGLSSNLWRVWRVARDVLKGSPNDAVVRDEIATWYRAASRSSPPDKNHNATSADEKSAREMFAALEREVDSAPSGSDDGNGVPKGSDDIARPSLKGSYFISPTSITIARQ